MSDPEAVADETALGAELSGSSMIRQSLSTMRPRRTTFARDFLMTELPVPARRLGLTVTIVGLVLALASLPALVLVHGLGAVAAIIIVAIAMLADDRVTYLNGFGIQTLSISTSAATFILLILGPVAIGVTGFTRFLLDLFTRPQIPAYRRLFNAGEYTLVYGPPAVLSSFIWSGAIREPIPMLVCLLVAGLLGTVVAVVVIVSMIAYAAGERPSLRQVFREIAESGATDVPIALTTLLLIVAWYHAGPLALVILVPALIVPLLVTMAPLVDPAKEVVASALAATVAASSEGDTTARRVATAEELVYRDGLTGLWNQRRFFHDLAGIDGGSEHAALLLGDVAGLKKVNDRRGHPAGDVLLRAVALGLNDAVRTRDRIYRLGGDEFAVFTAVSTDALDQIAARIDVKVRARIAADPALSGVTSWLRLGWAQALGDGVDIYDRADEMLVDVHRRDERAGRSADA
jgi:diguanylate cyclase (GGDEF)-like protein